MFSLDYDQLGFEDNDKLEVMNFLNEVSIRFPNAISFASGRPSEEGFDVQQWVKQIDLFAEYFAKQNGLSTKAVYDMLGQYGKTTGIINRLIAAELSKDENIEAHEQDIIVTYGAQEAMELCLSTLFCSQTDVLIATDPTYIGITGLAAIRNIEVVSVKCDAQGPDMDDLALVMADLKTQGKRAAAFYLIPDFNNPTGESISLQRRQQILSYCQLNQLLVIEDNPYGLFRYDGEVLPTLKALDIQSSGRAGCVIYIGTFAKTLCPGMRIGYLLAGQQVDKNGQLHPLVEEFSKVKSLVTVNTGQVAQAIIGGLLLETDCSLKSRIAPLVQSYKSNRDHMLLRLEQTFRAERFANCPISWNTPYGGFFLVIDLPFSFKEKEVFDCAAQYNVICLPLAFFSSTNDNDNKIRLAFSYVNHQQIDAGVTSLGDYIYSLYQQKAN